MELIIYSQEMWRLALDGQAQGVWFWASLYTFILCAYSLLFQIRTRFWPCTHGVLTGFEIRKFGGATEWVRSEQEYVSEALYKYNVGGVDYDGTRISPWVFVVSHNARFVLEKQKSSIQLYPDGRLKVFYNPNNPKKSFLIIAGKMGIYITVTLSVLPLILFCIEYHV